MPFATLAEYLAAVDNPWDRQIFQKSSLTITGNLPSSLWTASPNAGVAPGAAVVPTSATAGAVPFTNAGARALRVARVVSRTSGNNSLVFVDRLSHQSGLSGTALGQQVTNLPTAALTRYASGEGVMAALEIYSQIGATPQTVTCRYTNQAGVGGQVTPAVSIGGATGNQIVGRFLVLPLAAGDTGVRSVEGVTLSGSTGTAGDFGVTLFRPLFLVPTIAFDVHGQVLDAVLGGGGFIPEVLDDACLSALVISNVASSNVVMSALMFTQDAT